MDTNITLNLTLYTFKENDVYVCYCPSLNLSGYDKTQELADKSFEIVLEEYLTTCLKNNTLEKDLELHGWKNGVAPSHGDLLQMYPHFRELMYGTSELHRKNMGVSPYHLRNEYLQTQQRPFA